MKKLLILLVVVIFAVGMAVAQTSGSSGSAPDQNNATATQNQTTNTQSTTSTTDQSNPNANAGQTGATSDQNAAPSNTRKARRGANGNLPQTASPLPLIGLLGLGSLGAGVAARKRRK